MDKGFVEAAAEVVYHWNMLHTSRNPIDSADILVRLNNKVYDLSTHLPGFDSESGFINWNDYYSEVGNG